LMIGLKNPGKSQDYLVVMGINQVKVRGKVLAVPLARPCCYHLKYPMLSFAKGSRLCF